MEDGKKKVGASVSSALLEKFKEHVLEKHGQLWGYFSNEVENALSQYLQSEKVRIKKRNPDYTTENVYKDIRYYLGDLYGEVPSEVQASMLEKAIEQVRGNPPPACDRTVKKWKKRLKEEGLIKYTGLSKVELVG